MKHAVRLVASACAGSATSAPAAGDCSRGSTLLRCIALAALLTIGDGLGLRAGPSMAAATETSAAAGQPKDITFDDVKLDLKKGDPFKRSLLSDSVKKLDGKLVRIRGYILPSFQQTGIKQFVLVRDNMQCCFGPGAALYDCILVEMKGEATTDFTVRPISVEGKFTVNELLGPDGKHLAIYHLDGQSAK